MEGSMKKYSIGIVALLSIFIWMLPYTGKVTAESGESGSVVEIADANYEELEDREGNASLTTIKNLKTPEEKIAYYSEKCGNSTNGRVLYVLYEIQKYSVPVCFIGLVIASLNFFIIGNKKLDKREQGFSMLIAFGLGLIVFQVLPLLFAIIVAGR